MTFRMTLARAATALTLSLACAVPALAVDFTVDLVNEPSSLDPHMQWNPDSYYVYRNIFDNLVTRDNDGKIVPQVAESWEQLSDTELQMTIREGITFHDGTPLTAKDVAFSVKRITDPELGSPQLGQFNSITDAVAKDDRTVVLTTASPYPVLLAQLVNLSIVPQHAVEEVGDDAFNEAPVGSGPYKFGSLRRGVEVILDVNPDYWGDKGPFEQVAFKAVPDASTRVANLRAGTADLVVSLDSDQVMQLESASGVKVLSAPTERIGFMGLNTQRAPLDDPEMRKAVAMAIDREGIVAGILGGGEQVVDQMATPAHFGYIPDVAPIPYDPEAAREIVEAKGEAGQEPMIIKTAPVFDQRIVQALQQMLSEAGFNASIDMVDMATYLGDSRQEDRSKRPILGFGRWSCACQDVDGVIFPLLHSTSSWSRVNDPEIDALLEQARGTLDEDQRMDAYRQIQTRMEDQRYILPLYQAVALYGGSDKLDWTPTANESLFLNRMTWSE